MDRDEICEVLDSLIRKRSELDTKRARLEKSETIGRLPTEREREYERAIARLEAELTAARRAADLIRECDGGSGNGGMMAGRLGDFYELRYIDRAEYHPIASSLGVSYDTVKRDKRRLIALLAEHPEIVAAIKGGGA